MKHQTEMTPDEQMVRHVLSPRKGKGMAATQHELADACNMGKPMMRITIKALIFGHRKPIASSPDRIGGAITWSRMRRKRGRRRTGTSGRRRKSSAGRRCSCKFPRKNCSMKCK